MGAVSNGLVHTTPATRRFGRRGLPPTLPVLRGTCVNIRIPSILYPSSRRGLTRSRGKVRRSQVVCNCICLSSPVMWGRGGLRGARTFRPAAKPLASCRGSLGGGLWIQWTPTCTTGSLTGGVYPARTTYVEARVGETWTPCLNSRGHPQPHEKAIALCVVGSGVTHRPTTAQLDENHRWTAVRQRCTIR